MVTTKLLELAPALFLPAHSLFTLSLTSLEFAPALFLLAHSLFLPAPFLPELAPALFSPASSLFLPAPPLLALALSLFTLATFQDQTPQAYIAPWSEVHQGAREVIFTGGDVVFIAQLNCNATNVFWSN